MSVEDIEKAIKSETVSVIGPNTYRSKEIYLALIEGDEVVASFDGQCNFVVADTPEKKREALKWRTVGLVEQNPSRDTLDNPLA